MKYKIAFFDIDGTIYDHSLPGIHQSTIKCIQQLRQQGIKIYFCTGRSLSLLIELGVDDLIEVDGYVTNNGAFVFNKEKKCLASFPIDDSKKTEIMDLITREKFCIHVIEEKEDYLINEADAYCLNVYQELHILTPIVKKYSEKKIYQGILFWNQNLVKKYESLLSGLSIHRFHEHAIDIFAPSVNKAKGMEVVLNNLGFTPDETIAIGDGNNDIEMIQYAGLGIAMGNGNAELKKHAKYVTSSIEENGFALAFRNLKIIQ